MKLTILGLPLGNIEDISLRAIKTLKTAPLVICEDTRVFNKLWLKLNQIGLVEGSFAGKLLVINDFNESKQALSLAKVIAEAGEAVLVSDAGMPSISDPGFKLIREILKEGGEVISIPGPTAVTTAMAISGLPTDKFLFLGFLPQKNSKRNDVFEHLESLNWNMTVVLYESPYRLKKTLEEIQNRFGDLEASVSFELTKMHERTLRGNLSQVLNQLQSSLLKGEVTVCIHFSSEKS